jgi:hypothetical protein
MSLTKRISGDYNIVSVGTSDNVSITTNTVSIDGNLVVTGATTTISTTNSALKDNIIVLNDGESGAGVTAGSAGILIDRGSSANVELRWNESIAKWQITTDGTNYSNIAATSGGASTLTQVADDPAPYLGGDLNVNSKIITSSVTSNVTVTGGNIVLNPTNNIEFDKNLRLKNTSSTVTGASGFIVVSANTSSTGGTGLYVNNSSTTDELVSKTKARKFGIIFG